MVYHARRADSLRLKIAAAEVQHLVPVGTIPGIVVEAVAARCGPGAARIRSSADGQRLAFRAPGSAVWGLDVVADVDTTFLLQDGEDPDKWARVTRYGEYMLTGQAEGRILLDDVFNNGVGHDDVTAGEALAGDVETYEIELWNDSLHRFSHLVVWLDAAVTGMEIFKEMVGWFSPTTEATGISLPDIGPGSFKSVMLRRTIDPAAESDTDVLQHLHFAFDGL